MFLCRLPFTPHHCQRAASQKCIRQSPWWWALPGGDVSPENGSFGLQRRCWKPSEHTEAPGLGDARSRVLEHPPTQPHRRPTGSSSCSGEGSGWQTDLFHLPGKLFKATPGTLIQESFSFLQRAEKLPRRGTKVPERHRSPRVRPTSWRGGQGAGPPLTPSHHLQHCQQTRTRLLGVWDLSAARSTTDVSGKSESQRGGLNNKIPSTQLRPLTKLP